MDKHNAHIFLFFLFLFYFPLYFFPPLHVAATTPPLAMEINDEQQAREQFFAEYLDAEVRRGDDTWRRRSV